MSRSANEKRFREELPKALVLLRKARGWSQSELAQRMGVSQPILCRFEKGNRTPTSVSLAEHLKALQADWSDLNRALEEVRRAQDSGSAPSPQAVSLGEESNREALLVAYLAAAAEGRADEFVDRAMEQAQYLAQLRDQVKRRQAEREPDAKDPSEPAKEGTSAAGDLAG